jgi:Phage tail assembly chaperone proteins, E, or 41 or 14
MLLRLPGGYIDPDGKVHGEVELSPLTGADEVYLRDFASATPSARIITGLLARCVRRVGSAPAMSEDIARDMLVGDREYLVVRLFEQSCGAATNVQLRCPGEDCGKIMDVALPLAAMVPDPRPLSRGRHELDLQSDPPRRITFRLPTGADQEALSDIADETRAAAALLARCTGLDQDELDGLGVAACEEIEAAMEQLAPQADVEIEANCPECGRLFSGRSALPLHCLAEVATQAAWVEREVHVLAWHYHWSEAEILSLTRMKRRRYIDLIEQELVAGGEVRWAAS